MQRRRFLAMFFLTMVGCDQQGTLVPNQKPQQPLPTESQSEAAKAHVQQYIDRLMGGDQSVKQGLLGIAGVDFNAIDSIEIKSAVPTYLPDGRKVDDMIRVLISVKGYDDLKKQNIERNVSKEVILKEGKWRILGSNL